MEGSTKRLMLWLIPCSKEFRTQFCLQRHCCHAHVSLKDPTKSTEVAAYDKEHSWVLILYRQSKQRNARKARYSGLRIWTLTPAYLNANSVDFKEVSPV